MRVIIGALAIGSLFFASVATVGSGFTGSTSDLLTYKYAPAGDLILKYSSCSPMICTSVPSSIFVCTVVFISFRSLPARTFKSARFTRPTVPSPRFSTYALATYEYEPSGGMIFSQSNFTPTTVTGAPLSSFIVA